MKTIKTIGCGSTEDENENRKKLVELFNQRPIPDNEILSNLPLFLKRIDLTKILFANDLYQKIIDINGVIMEFGVRWGHNLALYESLRGIMNHITTQEKSLGLIHLKVSHQLTQRMERTI